MVTKSAVIGIDLGASDSYVAYVGKGMVDVVQNEVSKRSTPSLVGFTDRERLLGDSALASIKSNAKNTCRNFKHLIGRQLDASDVEKENFWSTCKLATAEDGFTGYDVTFRGESKVLSATETTAMYLTKLKEITESWCSAKVADIVISCPSYFADVQRQALLDAAHIAGLSVLRVMNEHTATALAYGIYRSNDFDPEKPMTVAFCSFGHSLFSVAIVEFLRGKLRVLNEKSEKVGGRDLDECLMREFGKQFSKKVKGKDVLQDKKAAFKLEDAVTKCKKQLSANSEAPINVEFLMDDEDFSSSITREDFEKMCEPAKAKVQAVLDAVIAECTVPIDQIDSVEIVGGSSRVPWWKAMVSQAFGGKTLSTTMNQEESVARGCALQAAILSPLYKVRDFKVEDSTPFAINVGWTGSAANAAASTEAGGDIDMNGSEGEVKTATVFPSGTPMNMLKILSFWRKGPFELRADYTDEKLLLPKTPKELGTWRIELPVQEEPRKINVKAKLTQHGTFTVEGAMIVEEEEYEEKTKEKRELPPDPEVLKVDLDTAPESPTLAKEKAAAASPDGDAPMEGQEDEDKENQDGKKEPEKSPEGDVAMDEDKENQDIDADTAKKEPVEKKEPEKKPVEKKYEWVSVIKKKKRTKKTDIDCHATGCPGLSAAVLAKRKDEESKIQAEMKEIVDTDEKKNDLESYIFTTRDKISGEWAAFISDPDRETFNGDLTKAEDWLYDTYDATKLQFIEKLDELKLTSGPVIWRHSEAGMRADWVAAVDGTVKNYRAAAETPGEKYGHIASEKLQKIVEACNALEKWITDLKAKQEVMPKHEKPVLLCAEMEKKNQELAKTADDILKEPKPAPPKAEPPKEAPAKEAEKVDEEMHDEIPEIEEKIPEIEEKIPGIEEEPTNMEVD